jgi:hypothetical protein
MPTIGTSAKVARSPAAAAVAVLQATTTVDRLPLHQKTVIAHARAYLASDLRRRTVRESAT